MNDDEKPLAVMREAIIRNLLHPSKMDF
jgi:hypothetical protein